MTRVSTAGNYQSALLNLMAAQARGLEAQKKVSTEKIATDLGGFGRGAETLTALKSAQNRIDGFISAGEAVASRLTTQALAFDRVAEAADGARQAIAEALASGRVEGLMQMLDGQFATARGGLNLEHNGRPLFGGAVTDQPPVSARSLAELAAAPDAASVFTNDTIRTASKLNESTTVETGFLADEVGEPLFNILRDIQLFHEGAQGPIDGTMTEDVRAFLEGQLTRLKDAHTGVVAFAARSGAIQTQVDDNLKALDNQQLAMQQLIGKKTDVDMAQAVTELELSQISIQASAQVLAQLRQTSLLDLLAPY